MGKVVNLNQYRKQRSQKEREENASENRIKFGRTKKERMLLQLETQRSRADLDNKLLTDKSSTDDAPDTE
ncbi:MAG: DUF4169 family protein [Rhodospirillales bacterium]|nr:DUF4169 family protein [Rhodospirillales bacterium]